MDYLDIVLKGITTPNLVKHLEGYIKREQKKAADLRYSSEEFRDGIVGVLDRIESLMKMGFQQRKSHLEWVLYCAENRTLGINSLEPGQTEEESLKATIESCNKELDTMSLEDFPVSLKVLSDERYLGRINKSALDKVRSMFIRAIDPALAKSESLENRLFDLRFFELEMVQELKPEMIKILLDQLSIGDTPYAVAMLDYLGFFDHFLSEHSNTKEKMYKAT